MSSHDLVAVFGDLLAALPEIDSTLDAIQLDERNLPKVDEELTTPNLCATWTYHFYDESPVELVAFEADKQTIGCLGLSILSSIFHATDIELCSLHARSTIKTLRIKNGFPVSHSGYHTQPHKFEYNPGTPGVHPWNPRDVWSLPLVTLTNANDLVTPQNLPDRDIAVGFGGPEAAADLATLFLDASRQGNTQTEYVLEGELGFRGVAPGSAELSIWLPGGIGFLDSKPDLSAS